MLLKDKISIITGSSKGIGLATLDIFLNNGCKVIACYRNDNANFEKKLLNYKKIFPEKIFDYKFDLNSDENTKEVALDIVKKHPDIDILVNNAGNNIPEHFTKVQKKDMEYIVKLNTVSTFHTAQLCTLKMLETKNRKKIGGSIINMSSQMGHVGAPIRSVYNMTKAGLEGLTRGMAIDLAKDNIRVNTVCPTFVVTPMTKNFLKSKKFKKDTLNKIPMGKFAELSDVATAVAFLASDSSSMITGTSILVDGGWTAI